MNKPVKPGATIVGPTGHSLVDDVTAPAPEHFGRFWKAGEPTPTWSPVAEEAPPTGLAYMRQKGLWVEGVAGGVTVTEIVPAVALVGMSAALPAKVYGTGFTAASVVNWDGVALATAFVSANELNITVDTTMGVAPSVAFITVTGATGAVGFHFISTSSVYVSDDPPVPQPPPNSLWWDSNSGKFYVLYDDGNTVQWVEIAGSSGELLDFGIGLTKDETQTPPIVNLQPAGDSPATLGGVYVVDRVRNVSEGLELGIDGRLRAPLATDALAGTLLEPPPDDKGYVRRRTAAGVSNWVPPADTPGYDYGIGLAVDRTPVPPDQPIVNLTPAGPLPQHLGGVYVPERNATTTGLSVNLSVDPIPATGELLAPPATDLLLGTLTEPKQDGISYSRHWDNKTDPANPKWAWTPALTAGLQITSIIPDKAIYGPTELPLTVHAYGSEFTATCVIHVDGNPAQTAFVSATELTFVMNPAVPISDQFHIITVHETAPTPVDGLGAEQFDFIKASTEVDYGTGLSLDTAPTPPIVHLDPAGPTNLGGVIVSVRDGTTQGLQIDFGDGTGADPATGELWAPPATATLLGTVKVPERTQGQGLTLEGDGGLYLRIATDQHLGGILEPSETDKPMVRVVDPTTRLGAWEEAPSGMEEPPMEPAQTWGRSSGGVRGWLPLPDGGVEAGRGLSKTEDPTTLHLNVATFTELGGVFVPGANGLELTPVGGLTLKRATLNEIGGIKEAPGGKAYARKDADWVETKEGMEEPPMDPVQTWGRSSGGVRGWLPIPDSGIEDVPPAPKGQHWVRELGVWRELPSIAPAPRPAGKSQPEIGVVYVPDRLGLAVGPDGQLALTPATPDQIGGLREVPGPGEFVRKQGSWEPYTATVVNAGIGLEKTGNTIDLQVATGGDQPGAPEIGGVYGTKRSDRNAVVIDPQGHINVPPATDTLLGGILDPPPDDKQYARQRTALGNSLWAEIIPNSGGINDVPQHPVAEEYLRSYGRWLPVQKGGQAQPRKVNIGGDTMTGLLILSGNATDPLGAVAYQQLDGLKVYVDAQDTADKLWTTTYFTQQPPAGGPYWMLDGTWSNIPAMATVVDYGVGLTLDTTTTPNQTVNLNVANTNGEIGGVKVVARSPLNGMEYDITTGTIWSPPATDALPGVITEPPADQKGYVRASQADGSWRWVPPADSGGGGLTISDTPPANPANEDLWWESDTGALFVFYVDPSGPPGQWVQVNGETAPPTIYVDDAPPMSPTANQLWWDSDAGTLNLWYADPDSQQWVQIAAPQIPGIPEAPIDGVPYSRRDANWVATTALAATPGDLKDGFQVNDHGGWVKLDGRAVTMLTVTQQAQAALLGFTVNLPDGTGAVALMNGSAMGAVAGAMTKTIALANLPAVNVGNSAVLTSGNSAVLTSGGFDAAAATTSTGLADWNTSLTGPGFGAVRGRTATGNTGYYFVDAEGSNVKSIAHTHTVDLPSHTHTVPAHNHSIPAHAHSLGGSGTPLDVTPKSISVNKFLFLGA